MLFTHFFLSTAGYKQGGQDKNQFYYLPMSQALFDDCTILAPFGFTPFLLTHKSTFLKHLGGFSNLNDLLHTCNQVFLNRKHTAKTNWCTFMKKKIIENTIKIIKKSFIEKGEVLHALFFE